MRHVNIKIAGNPEAAGLLVSIMRGIELREDWSVEIGEGPAPDDPRTVKVEISGDDVEAINTMGSAMRKVALDQDWDFTIRVPFARSSPGMGQAYGKFERTMGGTIRLDLDSVVQAPSVGEVG